MDRDELAQLSLADAYRHLRRERQRALLDRIAALPPVTNYDTAIEIIRLFREFLVAESMADGADWDPQLAQRLNAALAIALTAIAASIEARDLQAALDFR